jgi:hypothetical protein
VAALAVVLLVGTLTSFLMQLRPILVVVVVELA